MIQEYNYISINEILSRVKEHPFLENISFGKVVKYVVNFFRRVGLPKMFIDKNDIIDIVDYRGKLPCDLVQINQIRDLHTKICLHSMTDNFNGHNKHYCERKELSFKTQGSVLFVSFKFGKVEISYKALPTDGEGYPMLLDNPVFMDALEAYIKLEEFTIFFDMAMIPAVVLDNARKQYSWNVGKLESEMTLPSVSEMETINRMWNTLVQRTTDFDSGFNHLGDREKLKIQR